MPLSVLPGRHPFAAAFCAALLTFCSLSSAYATDAAAPGTLLSVPGGLGGASFIVPSFLFSPDPRASAYNPAAAADRELPVFGAAATCAFPTGQGSGAGGGASVFAAFPTLLGSVYALADGVFSPAVLTGFSAPLGTSGLIGLSKSAGDDLAFGASFGAALLSGNVSASGLFGAIGAQTRFPKIAAGGLDVSVAVLGMGSRPKPWNAYAPTISWTPLAAASARLIDARAFSLAASALFASPSFSDLLFSAGLSFGLGGAVNLDVGWLFSLSETVRFASGDSAGLNAPRFIPSVALRLDGSSFLRVGSYGASLGASFRPVSAGASAVEASVVFSRGNRDIEGPRISAGPLVNLEYSPLRTDAIRIPVSFADASPITAWEAVVYDDSGSVFFRAGENPSQKEKDGAFSRFFSLRTGVVTPVLVAIPLSKNAGNGQYRLHLWARDIHGNEGKAEELRFSIDGEAPRAEVRVVSPEPSSSNGEVVFTPNGDGVRDSLSIFQSGSVEALWLGRFLDSNGKSVRSFRWSDGAPLPFVWDGSDETGKRAPDGRYSYFLESIDAAGNAASFTIPGITLDSVPTPVSLSLDSNVLSPDGDGLFDSVRLSVNAPVKKGLTDWNIELLTDKGAAFRAWSGLSARLAELPASIVFDGRNVDGDVIPDGTYRFKALLRYANGNQSQAVSSSFLVDTKKPEGRVRVSSNLFSIDSGTSLTFYHDLSRNAQWRGVVSGEDGKVVRSLSIKAGESSVEWNGLDSEGTPVPDGRYRYQAEGKSASGIAGSTASVVFRIESGGSAVSLVADRKLFSPTLARSSVRLLPRLEKRERVVSYTLDIVPLAGGSPVRRFTGLSLPPSSIVWDGLDDTNRICADGAYRATLSVRYENGRDAISAPVAIGLDGTPPSAKITLGSDVFSPNGDGNRDSIDINETVSAGDDWFAEIVDESGKTVWERDFGSNAPLTFKWDGKTEQGDPANDGVYRYRLTSTDAAGNTGKAESIPFRLDSRKPSVVVSVDKLAFSPNGDGFADILRVRVVPSFTDGLASFVVRVLDETGKEVKRFPSDTLKSEYEWDGKESDGSAAPDGRYKAVVDLNYEKGDRVTAESALSLLDVTPPVISAELSPLPFSPDDDGENDSLNIRLAATDASPLAGWSFTILDPEGYQFTSYSGRALPSEPIIWDGTDADGNLVEAAQDYSYVFTVRDQLGNVSRKEGKIPVDIFVLRDGDKLKIRVSSITFEPNAASLILSDSALTEKNRAILDRIVAVLGKFQNYRIRVEGHAVNLSGSDREERMELAPLSLARAQTVVDALVQRGISRDRLEARGLGGTEPVVPHGDAQSRWRNRRVEFILVR